MKMRLPYFLDKYLTKKFSMLSCDIKFDVHDSNGRLVHSHKQVAHSVTANFLCFCYFQMHNYASGNTNFGFTAPYTNNSNAKTITGAFVVKAVGSYMRSEGTVNLDNTGIIIGRGIPVVNPLTSNLTSKIVHGTGANQMLYQQQTSPEGVVVVGNQSSFRFLRSFINSSLAPIDVSEVGTNILSTDTFLGFIDPVAPAVTVNDGQTLTIEITYLINT